MAFRFGISNQQMADILVTAFESSYSWLGIKTFVRPAKGTPYPFKMTENADAGFDANYTPRYGWLPLVAGGAVIVTDEFSYDDPKEALYPKAVLDRGALSKGLDLVAKHPNAEILKRLISGQYDAGDADVFVQLAAFGEEVYG
jgi:hypothetical protein